MPALQTDRHLRALLALAVATVLFGSTVPLTKLALGWLDPAWLATARFAIAAPVLALFARAGLRDATTLPIVAFGAVGYGAVILLQNEGIARTSVLHATVILGSVPALVAIVALLWARTNAGGRTWAGLLIALTGMALVAGSGGSSSVAGDAIVLVAALLMAVFTVAQTRLLDGRDAVAVTGVQMAAAGVVAMLVAAPQGLPQPIGTPAEVLAFGALVVAGTLIPYALFAIGQQRVSAQTAGAFLNVEPVVGAAIGVCAFGDPLGVLQAVGALAVLAGIVLSVERPGTPALAAPA